jgi:hypothetical protein
LEPLKVPESPVTGTHHTTFMIESQCFLPLNDLIIRIDGHSKDESIRSYAPHSDPRKFTSGLSLLSAQIEDPPKIKMTALCVFQASEWHVPPNLEAFIYVGKPVRHVSQTDSVAQWQTACGRFTNRLMHYEFSRESHKRPVNSVCWLLPPCSQGNS